MIKSREIADPKSCLNKAADDEMVFVLRAKDPVFSEVVRFWADLRIKYGIDCPGDAKIAEARATADKIADEVVRAACDWQEKYVAG